MHACRMHPNFLKEDSSPRGVAGFEVTDGLLDLSWIPRAVGAAKAGGTPRRARACRLNAFRRGELADPPPLHPFWAPTPSARERMQRRASAPAFPGSARRPSSVRRSVLA